MVLFGPLVFKAGIGGGIHFEYSYYVPVIAGFDIMISKNTTLTANISVPVMGNDEIKNTIRATVGVAMSGRYEN